MFSECLDRILYKTCYATLMIWISDLKFHPMVYMLKKEKNLISLAIFHSYLASRCRLDLIRIPFTLELTTLSHAKADRPFVFRREKKYVWPGDEKFTSHLSGRVAQSRMGQCIRAIASYCTSYLCTKNLFFVVV